MFGITGGPRASSQVSIQYMSDLHLERIKYQYEVQPAAPYLLLVGDIGRFVADYDRYRDFLATQCSQFERVLLGAGNHEFYGSSRSEGLAAAEKPVADPAMCGKLVFLNRDRYEVSDSDVVVLGCTLQSHIAPNYTKLTNDFERIKDWRVRDHNTEHQKDLAWLQDTLEHLSTENPPPRVIIATHYAPAFEKTTHPMPEGSDVSHCFSSHTLKAMKVWTGSELVSHWVFGHTHWNAKFRSGNMTVLSNQLCSGSQNLSWWQKRMVYRPFDPKAVVQV